MLDVSPNIVPESPNQADAPRETHGTAEAITRRAVGGGELHTLGDGARDRIQTAKDIGRALVGVGPNIVKKSPNQADAPRLAYRLAEAITRRAVGGGELHTLGDGARDRIQTAKDIGRALVGVGPNIVLDSRDEADAA